MTTIGKRKAVSILRSIVAAEGRDRTAVCYYTKASAKTGVPISNGEWETANEADVTTPECIVGQVVARLGGDMHNLSSCSATWKHIVNEATGDSEVKVKSVRDVFPADVHLTPGANAILNAAQCVQDGREADARECIGADRLDENAWDAEGGTWGQALDFVVEHYAVLNKVPSITD